jgi:cytochrome c55X
MEKYILFFILFSFSVMNATYAQTPSIARQSELKNLLLQDCGSCHGMTMKGGIGPALTTTALSNKTEAFLFQTISDGRHKTPMPPWKNILTKDEIMWLVKTLKQGVSDEK